MDLQQSTCHGITKRLRGLRVHHHQSREWSHVCGQEVEQIQDHAI